MGPDLNINGDPGEAEVDRSPVAEPASHLAHHSQTTPTEGNSMLGKTRIGLKSFFLLSAWLSIRITEEFNSKMNRADETESESYIR